MTVEYKEHPEQKTVDIYVEGKVTQAEFDRIAPQIQSFMDTHGKIKILEVVKNFKGMELSMLLKGSAFDFKNLKHFSHCAVVTDMGWIGPFARLASSVMALQIRTFKLEEEPQAREWLQKA